MSIEEFIARLARSSRDFDWALHADIRAGSERRSRPRLHLVGSLKGEPAAHFDPLTAVCFASTGRAPEAGAWPETARILGLRVPDGGRILAAAQDRTWEDTGEGSRRPVPELVGLRQEMLRAVGLILERSAGA